jgi:hypothetical protein
VTLLPGQLARKVLAESIAASFYLCLLALPCFLPLTQSILLSLLFLYSCSTWFAAAVEPVHPSLPVLSSLASRRCLHRATDTLSFPAFFGLTNCIMRTSAALLALGYYAAGAVADEVVADGTAAEPSSSAAGVSLPAFTVSFFVPARLRLLEHLDSRTLRRYLYSTRGSANICSAD